MKRSFNKTRVWATANKEQSIASIIAILDEFPELNFEEKEKIIEIYKVIRSSQVISIEDLPYKVARHMRSYEDESGNNRKGIEELVQILREKSLIENEDEISLRLNPTARITSEKKLEQVNIFIGAFFQALQHSHSSTDKGEEVVIDLQYFNTLLSKELQMDTLRDMIDNLLLLRKQQHWVSLNGNIMLFHSSLSDIQTKTNLLLLQGQVLLPLLLQGQVSEHQKNTTNILVEKKLKILATQLGKSMNSFIDILALETLLKFLHTFEILNVEAGLFLYRTKFLILEGVLAKERFTDEQYEDLRLFYEKKTQQAHIMEELAHRILRGQSLDTFVEDYFNLSQEDFISSYFQRRRAEIKRSISKSKYEKIHKDLSEKQREILDSKNNLLIIA
ncbi:MAG: hypothetical protein LBU27_04550 [Candidatus Peribacteria bacterium]|nr:hypothetical protein [Candidatus Peribacteria bacterium]